MRRRTIRRLGVFWCALLFLVAVPCLAVPGQVRLLDVSDAIGPAVAD